MEVQAMEMIGIDIHRKQCQATVLDDTGNITEQRRFESKTDAIKAFISRHPNAKVAIEATSMYEHIYDTIRSCGVEVVVANPLKTRLIAEARVKTDKADSRILAMLMMADMLPESYVPDDETREARKDVRERLLLKKTSTALKNHIYSELLRRGIEYKDGVLGSKIGRKWAKNVLEEPRLDQTFNVLETTENAIAKYNEERLKPAFEQNQKAQLLTSIAGIGSYSSLMIVAELGDISRFPDSDKVVSYCGLNPGVHQSGEHAQYNSITKTGPNSLRWILIETAHSHLLHCKDKANCKLCQFYKKISRRRGPKIATVAMAAKMVRIIYWMLKLNKQYVSQGLETEGKHATDNGVNLVGFNH
jgi:transposase